MTVDAVSAKANVRSTLRPRASAVGRSQNKIREKLGVAARGAAPAE